MPWLYVNSHLSSQLVCIPDPHYLQTAGIGFTEDFALGLTPYTTVSGNGSLFTVASGPYGQTLNVAAQNSLTVARIERTYAALPVAEVEFYFNVTANNPDDAVAVAVYGATAGWGLLPRREGAFDGARRPQFSWTTSSLTQSTVYLGSSGLDINTWYKCRIFINSGTLTVSLQNMTTSGVVTYPITTNFAPLVANSFAFGADSSGLTCPTLYANIVLKQLNPLTVLLLHADTLFDSSSLPKTLIPFGTASVSPAASVFGNRAFVFNGSTDYYTLANAPEWSFAGDYTVEFWFNPSAPSGPTFTKAIAGTGTFASSSGWAVGHFQGNLSVRVNNTTYSGNGSIVPGTWYHVALVWSGSSFLVFLNGSLLYSGPGAPVTTSSSLIFGNCSPINADQYFQGFIDEIRVTKDRARYVNTFAPQAYPFCPDTASGDCDIDPYYVCNLACDPYYYYVTTLLNFNGTNGSTTFTDVSPRPATFTAFNGAQISTSVVRQGTGSGFFNGAVNNSYIQSPASIDNRFFTGDFTIETWCYLSSYSPTGNRNLLDMRTVSAQAAVLIDVLTADSRLGVYINAAYVLKDTINFPLNQWVHVAVSRYAGTIRLFVNGQQRASAASSTNFNLSTLPIRIGASFDGVGRSWDGYIDDLRITNGIGRYTGPFIPPYVELPNCQEGPNVIQVNESGVTTAEAASIGAVYGTGGVHAGLGFVNVSPYPARKLWSTDDGVTWNYAATGINCEYRITKYGGGRWVAVAGNSGPSNRSAYSTDGINWVESANMPATSFWYGLEFGNGEWLAANFGTTIAVSANGGVTWPTTRTAPGGQCEMLVFGNNVWIAGHRSNAAIYRSTDNGVSWSAAINITGGFNTQAGSYQNGLFFLTSSNLSKSVIYVSPDGLQWTAATLPATGFWGAAAWNGFVWLTRGVVGSSIAWAISTDGYTWYSYSSVGSFLNAGSNGGSVNPTSGFFSYPHFINGRSVRHRIEELPFELQPRTVTILHGESNTDTSCEKQKSVTSNGLTQVASASKKFGNGAWQFNGAVGNYLTVSQNDDFILNRFEFTAECWVNATTPQTQTTPFIFDISPSAGTIAAAGDMNVTVTRPSYANVVSVLIFNFSSTVPLLTGITDVIGAGWVHVGVIRDRNHWYLYVNGRLEATNYWPGSVNTAVQPMYIGGHPASAIYSMIGYVDEFRLTQRAVRYNATHPPVTQEFPTGVGDPLWSNVALLMKMNGANNGTAFTDSSSFGRTMTTVGTAVTSTVQSRFGTASMTTGVTTGSVTTPLTTNLNMYYAEFTVEGWFYSTGTTGFSTLVDFRGSGPITSSWGVFINHANNTLNVYNGPTATTIAYSREQSFENNQWFHWVVERSVDTLYLYVNGVLYWRVPYNPPPTHASGIRIGANMDGTDFLKGFLDEVRITNGVARYAPFSGFTPLPPVHGDNITEDPLYNSVVVLAHMDGTNGSTTVIDSSSYNRTAIVNNAIPGSAQLSTAVVRYGTASLHLSNVTFGAYQVGWTSSSDFNISSSDFTIEMWAYDLAGASAGLVARRVGGAAAGWAIQNDGLRAMVNGVWSDLQLSHARPSANEWHHHAWVRKGQRMSIFIDGKIVASMKNVTSISDQAVNLFLGQSDNASENKFRGYIDDFRFTKAARYDPEPTSPGFTPPTRPSCDYS